MKQPRFARFGGAIVRYGVGAMAVSARGTGGGHRQASKETGNGGGVMPLRRETHTPCTSP